MSPKLPPVRASAVHFTLIADAEPGLLPRLLQPFAKRDLIPDQMQARREGATMQVEIVLINPEPIYVDPIVGNLHQVVGVRDVRAISQLATKAA